MNPPPQQWKSMVWENWTVNGPLVTRHKRRPPVSIYFEQVQEITIKWCHSEWAPPPTTMKIYSMWKLNCNGPLVTRHKRRPPVSIYFKQVQGITIKMIPSRMSPPHNKENLWYGSNKLWWTLSNAQTRGVHHYQSILRIAGIVVNTVILPAQEDLWKPPPLRTYPNEKFENYLWWKYFENFDWSATATSGISKPPHTVDGDILKNFDWLATVTCGTVTPTQLIENIMKILGD